MNQPNLPGVERSYAQRGEDTRIVELLADLHPVGPESRVPRFLDIGAADGVTFSTTRLLAERGWGGMLVEPSPSHFMALVRLYGNDPRFTLVNAAVVPKLPLSALTTFHLSDDLVSSVDAAHAEKWKSAARFTKVYISPVRLDDLFEIESGRWDFVSIDAEGVSVELSKRFMDFVTACSPELRPRCLCVEYDDKRDDLVNYITARGYRLAHETAENLIFVVDA